MGSRRRVHDGHRCRRNEAMCHWHGTIDYCRGIRSNLGTDTAQVWVHEAVSLPTAPAAATPRAHSRTAQQIAPRRTIGTARARERTYRRRHLPRPQPPVARSRPVQHNMTRRNTVPPRRGGVALCHALPAAVASRAHRLVQPVGRWIVQPAMRTTRRWMAQAVLVTAQTIACTQHNMLQYSAACCNISRSVLQHHRAPAHIARRPCAQRGRDVHRSKVQTQHSCWQHAVARSGRRPVGSRPPDPGGGYRRRGGTKEPFVASHWQERARFARAVGCPASAGVRFFAAIVAVAVSATPALPPRSAPSRQQQRAIESSSSSSRAPLWMRKQAGRRSNSNSKGCGAQACAA